MKKADMITGIVLLVLSGYVIWESWLMPPSATFGPGAGFLPFWLGVLLAVLAVILFVAGLAPPGNGEGQRNPVFPGKQALFAIAAGLGWPCGLYPPHRDPGISGGHLPVRIVFLMGRGTREMAADV